MAALHAITVCAVRNGIYRIKEGPCIFFSLLLTKQSLALLVVQTALIYGSVRKLSPVRSKRYFPIVLVLYASCTKILRDFILYLYMTLKKEDRLVTYLYSMMIKRMIHANVGCTLSVCALTVIWYVFAMLTPKIVWKMNYAEKYKGDYNVLNSGCKELLPWTWQPGSWKVRHSAAFHWVAWIFNVSSFQVEEIFIWYSFHSQTSNNWKI